MTQEDKREDWWVKRYQELAGDYSTNANASIRILVEELLSSQRQLLMDKLKEKEKQWKLDDPWAFGRGMNQTAIYNECFELFKDLLHSNLEDKE